MPGGKRRKQIDDAVEEAVHGKKAPKSAPKLTDAGRSNLAKAAEVVGQLLDGPSMTGIGAGAGKMIADRLRKAQHTDHNN